MKQNKYTTIVAYFTEHNKNVYAKVGISKAMSTYLKYDHTKNLIAGFIKDRYRKEDYEMENIDMNFIMAFELHLLKNCRYKTNTISKVMEITRRILRLAENDKIISSTPFDDYKLKREEVKREYLTEEELILLLNKNLPYKRLEKVRDIFIFSCFTGLHYSDLSSLSSEHLEKGTDNSLPTLKIYRPKTYRPLIIPLLPVPQAILRKYGNTCSSGNLLPIVSLQKVNAYLKEIGNSCGFDKKLSFSLARHTFATMSMAKGVPIETISKILGHSNIRTTQSFIPMSNDKVGKDMLNFSEQLKGINYSIN